MSSDATPGPAPRSTYRLQLGPELTFAAAAGLADYLAGLGVTHAYLSPILRAAPGSTHGYDVVDHGHLNEELGGLRGFRKLAAALRAKNIGIVVDVVPNHMAVPVPEALNAALWSVLRHGRESPYDAWFDIDWDAGGGRLLMPLLDGPVESNLDRLFVERRRGRPPQLRYFDHVLPLADGTAQLPMRELVDAQHYRLADWRTASTELNYRRFCDITSLIGVRVEDPAVFATTHAVLVDLVADGDVQGLRIDHPDGLADPARYFADLAEVTDDAWVVVEKILADGEPLPADWRVAGTTGYETLTVLNGLLVDPAGEGPLSRTYTELTGDTADFATVAGEGKQLAARDLLAAEVSRLVRLLPASQSASGIESVETLRDAVVEVLTGLDVYRPYAASPMTLVAVEDAARHAGQRQPDLRPQIEEVRALALQPGEFATRFAQTAAAVFAKGVEDTAFYRHARLLALNEVGGDPGRFGVRLAEFHHFALELQASSPTAMTTLSTHDTKRGEDVRARLAVLSELPEDWDRAVRRWLPLGAKYGCPDDRTGYFFWQTLVGAWPLDVERATRYMEKATREAKLSTSWHSPDEYYDNAVRAFVTAVMSDDEILADVAVFVGVLEPYAHANSLSQKLVQLTMPGVPDVYQGCELPNYRLVDPDNRGAVDFAVRRELLGDLLDEKLRVTAVSLRLRRDHPHWFTGYAPLQAAGPAMDHIVAFARSAHLITVATRLSARLGREGGWRDTRIELPEGSWVDAITGTEHDGGEQLVGSLLRGGAVALLVPGVSLTA